MKHIPAIVIVALCLVSFSLSSCQKKEAGQGGSGLPSKAGAWIIRQPGAIHSMEEKDGVRSTKWLAALDIGSPVKVLDPEPQAMPFPGDSKPLDFIKAEAGGKSGWIFSGYLASGLDLGVIVEESAALYKGPAYGEVTNDKIGRLNLVVIQEVQGEFYKIAAYDKDKSVSYPGTRWVVSTSVDNTQTNVEAAKLLRKYQATPLDQGNVKIELLKLLNNRYASSAFSDLFGQEFGKVAAAKSGGAKVYSAAMVPDSAASAVDGEDAAVASTLVGTVKEGIGVAIAEQGASDTVDGKDGLWYRISAPLSGWVFSTQLEFAAVQ